MLRCQTPDGILKELTLYAVAYNLVRLVMFEADNVRVWIRTGSASWTANTAGLIPTGDTAAHADRQPGPPRSRRAAMPETPRKELSLHDPATIGIA